MDVNDLQAAISAEAEATCGETLPAFDFLDVSKETGEQQARYWAAYNARYAELLRDYQADDIAERDAALALLATHLHAEDASEYPTAYAALLSECRTYLDSWTLTTGRAATNDEVSDLARRIADRHGLGEGE